MQNGVYRADIDGLRAVSVIAVVLYHFEVPPFTGGFAGVDVFFVISGFLITSILWKDLERGRFSLLNFYDRRIRRIFPATLVVVLTSLLAGYVLLLPGDLEDLGRQAAFSATGLVNFYLMGNTGYFDQDAALLPLLHIWSLAVEDQFYLIWPLVLVGVAAVARQPATAVSGALIVIIAVSLAISIWLAERNPPVAFYMLHSRAWELALGALLVFAPALAPRLLAEVAGILGLALIAYAVIELSINDTFPGTNALYPCIGAALIVWPKTHETWVSRALALEPIRQIGLASFSLYLWHWPLLVFFRHWNNGSLPSSSGTAVLIAFSMALAFASLLLIERPFRRMQVRAPRKTLMAGGAAIGLALVPAVAAAATNGFPLRLPESAQKLSGLKTMWAWTCPAKVTLPGIEGELCAFGADWEMAPTRVLLWGDSHAEHFAPIVQASVARYRDVAVVLYAGCAPIIGGEVHHVERIVARSKNACAGHYRAVVDLLSKRRDISIVLIAAAWTGTLPRLYGEDGADAGSADRPKALLERGVSDLLATISHPGRKVHLLSDFPRWPSSGSLACAFGSLSKLPRRAQCSEEQMAISRQDYVARHGAANEALMAAARTQSARYLSPADNLCEGSVCRTWVAGEFIYRDVHHIRRNLAPETLKELARLTGVDDIFARRSRPGAAERRASGIP